MFINFCIHVICRNDENRNKLFSWSKRKNSQYFDYLQIKLRYKWPIY